MRKAFVQYVWIEQERNHPDPHETILADARRNIAVVYHHLAEEIAFFGIFTTILFKVSGKFN